MRGSNRHKISWQLTLYGPFWNAGTTEKYAQPLQGLWWSLGGTMGNLLIHHNLLPFNKLLSSEIKRHSDCVRGAGEHHHWIRTKTTLKDCVQLLFQQTLMKQRGRKIASLPPLPGDALTGKPWYCAVPQNSPRVVGDIGLGLHYFAIQIIHIHRLMFIHTMNKTGMPSLVQGWLFVSWQHLIAVDEVASCFVEFALPSNLTLGTAFDYIVGLLFTSATAKKYSKSIFSWNGNIRRVKPWQSPFFNGFAFLGGETHSFTSLYSSTWQNIIQPNAHSVQRSFSSTLFCPKSPRNSEYFLKNIWFF